MTDLLDFPALTGRQEPHHLLMAPPFEGSELRGDAAVQLANRIAGKKTLFPWQDTTTHAIMRWDPIANLWLHSTCVLIVPRQNGKSEILLYRCVYGLFVLNETIVFSVQRWKTGKKIAQRLKDMIYANPSLRARLAKRPTMSQGAAEFTLKSGATLTFITRSPDSGVGFDDVDLLIYDEAYNLTEGDTSALNPTTLASPHPQTIYASSAVNADIHPNGLVLTGLREAALGSTEPNGLFFGEWMAAPDMDRDDPLTWPYANPSYGIIQTDDKMRAEMRGQRTERARRIFDCNFLGRGIWPRLTDSGEELYADEVLAAVKPDGPIATRGSVVLTVDRSYVSREWVIAAGSFSEEGLPVLELGFVGKATNAEMIAKVKAAVAQFDPDALVIDRRSPAMMLQSQLVAEGIEPEVTGTSQMAVACQGFESDLLDGQLWIADQDAIAGAFASATKRTMPQGDWAWDRVDGGASIAPLVAITLARWALLEFGLDVGGNLPASPEHVAPAAAGGGGWLPDELDDFDAMLADF